MKLNKKRFWILILSTITILSITGCGGDGDGASSDNNLLYELFLPIFSPGKPVDPTNPGNPIEPGDPVNPIEPGNPVNPIEPSGNLPPVAIGSTTPTSVVVDLDFSTRITFDGSASYDQDTLIQPITYVWTAGPHEVKNVVAEAFASCANKYKDCVNNICTYTAYLEVSDGELSDTDKVLVNVDYNNCIDEVLPPEPLPCEELIKDKPDSIYITDNPETVKKRKDAQLHLWGVYAEGTECELTYEPAAVWSITDKDDEEIVSIDTKTGIVTGKEVGTATIEAKYRAEGAEESSVTSTVHVTR